MKLINGNQQTEHPAVLLLASLAVIFQLQEAGMHLNVALQGGSRENVFLLPPDIDEETPVYVLGIRRQETAASSALGSSTTRTPTRTPTNSREGRGLMTIQAPRPTPKPQLQVPRSNPFSGR